MDKILLLGLLLVLIVFIIISYNHKSEILGKRVNDNIDKQEDFNAHGGTYQYDTPTSCPVCSELKGGVCQPKYCPFAMRCATVTSHKKKQQAGNCYYY
jgi:hypothetical protein